MGYLANTAYFFPACKAGLYLLGLLNSNVSYASCKRTFVEKQGGSYEVQPQGRESFPVPLASSAQSNAVEWMARLVEFLARHFAANPADQTTRDPLMVAYLEQVLNGLVYERYFPEELHAAGLRLFELVERSVGQTLLSALPIPNADKNVRALFLPRLRQKFEELQTLDPMKIIEGKA